jgi:WD40 repeat protein
MEGGREVKKLTGFKNGGGAVAAIAYSPDGRLFAASQDDGTIRLWETASFQEFPPLSLGTNVFSVAFGPITFDRKHKPAEYLVAAGCKDGTIRTLRVAVAKDKTGIRRIFEPTSVNFPQRQGVICVRFSPDGKLLGATRFAGLISLYDPETGIAVREMRASNGNSDWLSFHPQRPWIATAHWNDRVARIWHQETGTMLCELRGHTAGVFCAEFTRDGRGIATSSDDFSIKIWDLVGANVPEAPKRAKKGKPPTLLVGD